MVRLSIWVNDFFFFSVYLHFRVWVKCWHQHCGLALPSCRVSWSTSLLSSTQAREPSPRTSPPLVDYSWIIDSLLTFAILIGFWFHLKRLPCYCQLTNPSGKICGGGSDFSWKGWGQDHCWFGFLWYDYRSEIVQWGIWGRRRRWRRGVYLSCDLQWCHVVSHDLFLPQEDPDVIEGDEEDHLIDPSEPSGEDLLTREFLANVRWF